MLNCIVVNPQFRILIVKVQSFYTWIYFVKMLASGESGH